MPGGVHGGSIPPIVLLTLMQAHASTGQDQISTIQKEADEAWRNLEMENTMVRKCDDEVSKKKKTMPGGVSWWFDSPNCFYSEASGVDLTGLLKKVWDQTHLVHMRKFKKKRRVSLTRVYTCRLGGLTTVPD